MSGVDAELGPDLPDLVLEERLQGLDEFEVHVLGQAADVVVALDGRRRALDRDALDDVGVERALREEPYVTEPLRFLLEDADELGADDLALLLRVFDAGELVEEPVARVDDVDLEVQLARAAA